MLSGRLHNNQRRHRPLPHPYHRYPNSQPQSPPPYLRNKCQHRKSTTLRLTYPKVCPPAHAQGHKHHFLGDKQNFNICRNSNDAPLCAGLEMSKVFGTMSYCHIWSALTWKWISKSKGRSSDHQVELERMVEPNCFTCQHHPAVNQGRGWITKIWREIPEHHHHHHH